MKVVLMSDSHGRDAYIDKILEMHKDADLFLHCGDIEHDEFVYPQLTTVRGNNDYFGDYPNVIKLTLGTHRVLMLHSHQCGFRDRYNQLSRLAKNEGCDTVFFGHTHVAIDEIVSGVRLINPGSLYYSRDGRPQSYCVINIDKDFEVEHFFAPFE